MRKFSVLTLLFIFTYTVNAQFSDLADLASGKLETFTAIKDVDDQVYGYIGIYMLEKVDDKNMRFEYVVLDKNLNKVASGEYLNPYYKKVERNTFVSKKVGDEILLSSLYYSYTLRYVTFTTHRILNVKTNKIGDAFHLEGKEDFVFADYNGPSNKLNKQLKDIHKFEFPVPFGKGFLLMEGQKKNARKVHIQRSLGAFTFDAKKLWEHPIAVDDEKLDFGIADINKDRIILKMEEPFGNKEIFLKVLNADTGEQLFKYTVEKRGDDFSHTFIVEQDDDRITIIGMFSPYKTTGYDYRKSAGVFRIELDKQGNELSNKRLFWPQMSAFIEIDKKGKVEKGYRLIPKELFVFKDGTAAVLTEKMKEASVLALQPGVRSTDFVLLKFDSAFELSGIETIKKDKSKYYAGDYLFSQYVKDRTGVAFFYQDYQKDDATKDRNWILGIVTMIDGKYMHESIPMTSEDFAIFPYVAKEGHILLREINKDDDYDQIRIERLNY
ncbi:DUF6770 family protein [Sungkyunkwania multivorans]|uniref:DUF6770 family protein n=1 Tax=Sungkyunkwania multivorans TaxID=1173618 RepID=A0ABW3D5H3_9FLAO